MMKQVVLGIIGGLAVAALSDASGFSSFTPTWWVFVVAGNSVLAFIFAWVLA